MMDVAVPANMRQGLHQEEVARRGWAVDATAAQALLGQPDVVLDRPARDEPNASATACIPGALHAPYPSLGENIGAGRPAARAGAARPASGWCSSAPSANAPPWRCRRRRMRASARPGISKAAWAPGRRPAACWHRALSAPPLQCWAKARVRSARRHPLQAAPFRTPHSSPAPAASAEVRPRGRSGCGQRWPCLRLPIAALPTPPCLRVPLN